MSSARYAPSTTDGVEDFDERIASRGAPAWSSTTRATTSTTRRASGTRSSAASTTRARPDSPAQLDFSATPRYQKGGLFTWTVYDYPLKQAIIDRVVKRPMKGITAGLDEARSDVASVKYQGYLTAGVERWREYRDQLKPLGKKPVLFVMLNSTAEADDVGDYLRVKYPAEFGATDDGAAQLLVIHTDRSGEVSKKDLDAAREVARRVDEGDSPVNAIVSVLMLREGWDVQNVTVIVGLRPYTAKANILPEQTIGRGLRLMFGATSSSYVERVDVIGNPAFLKFVEQLEKDEDITLDTFDLKEPVVITTIAPDENKLDHDITVPVLSPILARKKTLAEEIAGIDVVEADVPATSEEGRRRGSTAVPLRGLDIITLQKLVERDYTIPEPQTAEEVISYYAKRIAQDVKLPSQFAALVPKVREFLRDRAFGETVDLTDKAIIRAIATSVAQYVTVKTFATRSAGTGRRGAVANAGASGAPALRRRSPSRSRARRSRRARRSSTSSPPTTSSSGTSPTSCRMPPTSPRSPSCPGASASPSSTPTAPRTCATTSRTSSPWIGDGRALRDRDQGPGEHRRRPQGPGGDDLVRERDSPDRRDVVIHEGAPGRVRQAATTHPLRRSRRVRVDWRGRSINDEEQRIREEAANGHEAATYSSETQFEYAKRWRSVDRWVG